MHTLKYILFIVFFGLCCTLTGMSQPKGYRQLSDISGFRKKMETTARNTQSIKSDFVQEKNLNVVSEKIVSSGKFRFRKESMIRMEYVHPYRYLMIINKDKVIIKDGQKTSSFSSRSNKLFTIINNIIIDCVQGTALDNKDFTPAVYTNDKNELLVLTPAKKELKDFFESIQVYIDIKDGSVIKIDMLEPSGDNTVITFTDKQINVPVADSEFRAD